MSSVRAVLKRFGAYERAAALLGSRRSYSQFGEDVHIRSIYDRLAFETGVHVDRGLIVDIGSYRPIQLSNSYYFYRRGWTSINVDPTPGSKRLFDRVRPKDINLEVAVGREERPTRFYVFGNPSVWNTTDPEVAAIAEQKLGRSPEIVSVQTRRLDALLEQYANDLPFELLLIDAEGAELDILSSIDLSIHRPRIILFECHHADPNNIVGNEVSRMIQRCGYSLYSWINPNLLFLRDGSLQ